MPTFHVTISRDRTESKIVSVEADSEEVAEKKAVGGAPFWKGVVSDWEPGGDTDSEYISDTEEVPDKQVFQIDIAQYVRVYGHVFVAAASIEEATILVDEEYVRENFSTPHDGSEDYDYNNTRDPYMIKWEDDYGNGDAIGKKVSAKDAEPVEKPKSRPFTPTVILHGIMRDENGDTTHQDDPSIDCDAYEVFLRRDFIETKGDQEPFDAILSTEFEEYSDAETFACELAKEYQCEIEEY